MDHATLALLGLYLDLRRAIRPGATVEDGFYLGRSLGYLNEALAHAAGDGARPPRVRLFPGGTGILSHMNVRVWPADAAGADAALRMTARDFLALCEGFEGLFVR